jgi:hypothetical protein
MLQESSQQSAVDLHSFSASCFWSLSTSNACDECAAAFCTALWPAKVAQKHQCGLQQCIGLR